MLSNKREPLLSAQDSSDRDRSMSRRERSGSIEEGDAGRSIPLSPVISEGTRDSAKYSNTSTFGSNMNEVVGTNDAAAMARQSQLSTMNASLNLDYIDRSLQDMNEFAFGSTKKADKLPTILMFEISADGVSEFKYQTLRELLHQVNTEAKFIDREAKRREQLLNAAKAATAATNGINNGNNNSSNDAADGNTVSNVGIAGASRPQSLPPINTTAGGIRRSSVVSPTSTGSAGGGRLSGIFSDPLATDEVAGKKFYSAVGELRLRDLRRLDFKFNPNEERAVLIRRHAVLFAMDPIRAIVMSTRVILIVPEGADELLRVLERSIGEWSIQENAYSDSQATTPQFGSSVDLTMLDKSEVPVQQPQTTTRESAIAVLRRYSADDLQLPQRQSEIPPQKTDVTHSPLNKHNKVHDEWPEKKSNDDKPANVRGSTTSTTAGSSVVKSSVPFEVHAYEALLTIVKAVEIQDYNRVNEMVQKILVYCRSGSLLPIETQEQMREMKNDLSVMIKRVSEARLALNDLTSDDEEMALMNLTALKKKPSLYAYPLVPEILSKHDFMEEVLESYMIDFNTIQGKMDNLRAQIQSAEELVSLRLDTSRNELLFANTSLAVLACCFGLGAFITGAFGMNLDNTQTIQHTKHVFSSVVAVSVVTMVLLFIGIVFYMERTGMMPKRLNTRLEDEKYAALVAAATRAAAIPTTDAEAAARSSY